MLSYFVKNRIKKRSIEWNIELPINYESILNNYKRLSVLHGNKLMFSYLYDNGSNTINANSLIYKLILVNAEWAARLILFNDESTKNAFLFTLGHELTHKEKDFFCFPLTKCDFKFILWTSEVHADFGAAQKISDSRLQDLLDSIAYKSALNDKSSKTLMPPSWKQRKQYAETGIFNQKLIEKIASETNCTNVGLIKRVCDFYKPIELH